MTLPAPNLDDRRFQDLVDEAKRMVQARCPEWTDHNVSDPGVTLIETFAFMVDQLIYRVNRVPDRMYLKFLDLLGVSAFPPTAAGTDVTFWLTAPQATEISIPRGTNVSTTRTETEEAIVFTVTRDLVIPPVELVRLLSSAGQPPQIKDRTAGFEIGAGFDAFSEDPEAYDAMYLGLSRPSPSCALLLRFDCEVRGLGVDPKNPPLAWEVFDGSGWVGCTVQTDTTGGLNRAGDVILHLPQRQVLSSIGNLTAAWLRCRVVAAAPGQAAYSASPRIRRLTVATMGGTTRASNADLIGNEVVGASAGVPGQRFALRHLPVVPAEQPEVLEVSGPEGWQTWSKVSSFAESGPEDRHFLLDAAAGEVAFGPAVREPDGRLRSYGAVPAAGAAIRIRAYRTGGGRRGNVAPGAINVLKSSIPFIARVENLSLGTGGVDGETIESVKVRGPLTLRTRDRAVTREDYEYLVRQVAPEIARVQCIPRTGAASGAVRVLVVPAVDTGDPATLSRAQLDPPAETMQRIRDYLEERRMIGVQVAIEPPAYKGLTVVAKVHCGRRYSPEAVQTAATAALHRYLHPVIGGPDGTGWIFGRPVGLAEMLAVLDDVEGTDVVDEVLLFSADPATGERERRSMQRLQIGRDELPLSFGHQVFVERR